MLDNHVRSQYVRACCEEPFRIFFPIGVLLGVVGVSLWLPFYLGAGIPYPNVAHARLMIEGFVGFVHLWISRNRRPQDHFGF